MRLRSRSLRTRLVAVVLLLLAAAALVIGLVVTLAMNDILYGKLEDDILGTANRVVARGCTPPQFGSARGPGAPGASAGAPSFGPPETLFARIGTDKAVTEACITSRFGESIRGVSPDDYAALLDLPVQDKPASQSVDQSSSRPQLASVDLGDLGTYRVLTMHDNGDVVVVGQSEERPKDTIDQLLITEITVTLIALGGAGGVGLLLVRRELRPLERVAATARRVSALPLERGEVSIAPRVPDVDPRTEVGQVGLALNHMLDHVGGALEARQESETQLRQFVADASHELRTPLSAIRGYAELTRRAQLTPEAEYSLTRISSQAERMTTLVEDLLLLARLDAGRPLERSPVDLTRLVLDAVSDAHVAGPEHHWSLDLPEEPVTVTGDGSRLTQVLTNLLANARTHTPPHTAVTVALSATSHGAALSVADDGPGIAPELLPHIFERFARGSTSRSREHGSTGLGLAIVHAVVAAHGGRVEVASRPGRTEFRVLLPAEPAPVVPETQEQLANR